MGVIWRVETGPAKVVLEGSTSYPGEALGMECPAEENHPHGHLCILMYSWISDPHLIRVLYSPTDETPVSASHLNKLPSSARGLYADRRR